MKKALIFFTILSSIFSVHVFAQKITYSEPDRDDARNMVYDIVGKMNGNIIIYKNNREVHSISVYDANMKSIDKVRMDYLPDRVFNIDFIQYPDFFYAIYQYQKKNIVYCMAAKLNAQGKIMNDPVQIDTTDINITASNKIYSFVNSEDKQKFMLFKINTKNDKVSVVTTLLYDRALALLHKSRLAIPMPERNDFLAEFQIDNDGDMACVKEWGTAQNDNISKLSIITKPALSDEIKTDDLKINGLYLDDIRLKVDNFNKHYLVTSFFSKQRRGNVDCIYLYLWSKDNKKEILSNTVAFSDELRADAKGQGSIKTAFNDYFLRNIIMKKDGGFFIAAESVYTSSRGNAMNRWDYLGGSPFWTPSDYYMYRSPFYYPGSRFNMYDVTRYFVDNIAVMAFDINGKMEWSNVITKSQYDDNSDHFIGYGLLNTGDQIHFLFNMQEKRQTIFGDQSITPAGQIVRNPVFKNLDKGFDFMAKELKQVGARQVIVPCQYRNYICFAKVEL